MIMLKLHALLCVCVYAITFSTLYSYINKNLTGDLKMEIGSISNIYHS